VPASDIVPRRKMLECVIPILRVLNLEASIDYYLKVLGFVQDWRTQMLASVSRDGLAIMLCQGDQGHPGTWVWIGVEDAAELHRELVSRGATIRQAPANYPWALEFRVEDPDGHVLRFGSEAKHDRPFEIPPEQAIGRP
jgi:uncharacterized glyoxalase superfamily protein PhnB